MEYAADERFFRRLNPRFAFTAEAPGTFRLTSAAYKAGRLGADGRFEISVDAERLITLEDERFLAAREHPGFGIGAVTFAAIEASGAMLRASPTVNNPAHHDIFCTKGQARILARSTEVIDWPAAPIVTNSEEA
jgi:hypothetical protein